jgi:hypothetical protein
MLAAVSIGIIRRDMIYCGLERMWECTKLKAIDHCSSYHVRKMRNVKLQLAA